MPIVVGKVWIFASKIYPQILPPVENSCARRIASCWGLDLMFVDGFEKKRWTKSFSKCIHRFNVYEFIQFIWRL